MYTKQEYYDLIVVSGLDGTFPSMRKTYSGGFACAYRGINGGICIAGLLMPDKHYNSSMEGAGAENSEVKPFLEIPAGMNIHDITKLQEFHDVEARQPIWNFGAFIRRVNTLTTFRNVKQAKGIPA